MRTEAIYSEFATARVSDLHLLLAETQRQAKEWESFIEKNRKGLRYALIGGCWHGKLEDQFDRDAENG